MSLNVGTITYGNVTILPAYDTASAGFGNLIVSGTSLFAGTSTTVSGTLGVTGASTLSSTLTVGGLSTFNANATFNSLATFAGGIVLSNVTDSSNANSGSLQVKGGLGVSLSTYLGGILDVTGATTLRSTLAVTGTSAFTGAVSITDTTESNYYTQGALTVAGGLGVAGNIRSGVGSLFLAGNLIVKCDRTTGYAYLNSPANSLYINQAGVYNVFVNQNSSANFNVANAINVNTSGLQVLTNTDSTSYSNGSLTVAGGAAIAMSLNVGGNITSPATQTLTIGSAVFTNTAQSTSTVTGGIQTAGGVGVAKNVFVGGFLDVASTAATYSSIGNFRMLSASNGANWIQSGDVGRTNNNWTSLRFAPLGSQVSIMSVNSGNVSIDTGTASTSSTTGAFVVTGGTGISGDLYVGASANFTGVSNFQSDVWVNGHNLFLGTYNDQSNGLVFSNTASAGGPLLFGLNGGALGTTTGALKTALVWDANQTVTVRGATESTSVGTGGLVVLGGVGVAKSVTIGSTLTVQGGSWTSTGTDIYLNTGGGNINLRNAVGSNSGEFESNLTDFNFRTVNVTTPTTIAPFRAFVINKTTGYVFVRQTDDTTGNQTGSLQVYGGESISKSLWVGGNTTVQGNLQVAGSISTTGNNPVTFSNTTNSTSVTTGAMVVAGGMGIGLNLYVGGLGRFTNTTPSTSTTTGAVVIGGGLGVNTDVNIGGNGTVGGNLTVAGNITSTAGSVQFTNTTQSTSVSTGSVVIGGGLGLGGNIFVGGVATFTNTTATSSVTTGSIVTPGGLGVGGGMYLGGVLNITSAAGSTTPTTGSFITAGGAGIGQNLNVGGNAIVNGALSVVGNISSTGGTVHFTNTVDSTAATGGSLVVDGGVGIAKSLFVGSTNNSTSPSTGGLVLSGGFGVAGNTFLGGNLTLAGTSPLFTFNTSGLAPPAFNTRSAGTKILFYGVGGAAATDFAIGMDNNVLWQSVPSNTSTHNFRWFGATTVAMNLDGLGILTLNGTVDATAPTGSGTVQIAGGVGIGRSLYVGAAMNVTGTAFFNGAVTTNTNLTSGGIVTVTNATNSTSAANGSIVTSGGLGVALSTYIGQNLSVGGTATVTGNVTTTGIMTVNNNTDSTTVSNGCAVFVGGVGIARSVNIGGTLVVGGTTTINGNLVVTGNRTEVDTTVISMKDNVVLVNNGPSGSASSGFAMKRYQFANDAGNGDLLHYETPEMSGTVQAGSTATTIVLGPEASATDGWYNGGWVYITSGTGTGQVRRINTYTGATRTATIYTSADQASLSPTPVEGLDWTTIPDSTSTYAVFTSQYVVTVYDEVNKEYALGTTAVNPVSDPSVPIRNRLKMHAGILKLSQHLYTDKIDEYTTGSGVTIGGVTVKGGDLTGITSMNGSSMAVTATVTLPDNNPAAVASIPGTRTYGAYYILVSDVNNTGSSAVFMITGSNARAGSVFRGTATAGANNEHLTIVWNQGETPSLKFMNMPNNPTGATYSYRVKTIAW
jgi:fibronectin-binding autotransporter adhesin